MTINDKSCNLPIVLTDYPPSRRLNVNVMLSNIEPHNHAKFS